MLVFGKDINDLYKLADECDELAKDCERELERIKKEEENKAAFQTQKVIVGLLLLCLTMVSYFALLWGTDVLSTLEIIGKVPTGQFIDIIRLPDNGFIAVMQIAFPLGIIALVMGISSLIFLKHTHTPGAFMLICMLLATSISYVLWSQTNGNFIIEVLGFTIMFGVPVIPGFLLASYRGSRGGDTLTTRQSDNKPTKKIETLATFLSVLTIAIFIFGIHHTWSITGFENYNVHNETPPDDWSVAFYIPPFPDMPLVRNATTNNRNDVMLIQERLNVIGTYRDERLAVDGIFGPLTEAAVIGFQELIGAELNGIVNEYLWIQMFHWPILNIAQANLPMFPTMFTTTTDLNFRELPDTNSAVISVVPVGTQVLVVYVSPGNTSWFAVEHGGQFGYLNANFLAPAH